MLFRLVSPKKTILSPQTTNTDIVTRVPIIVVASKVRYDIKITIFHGEDISGQEINICPNVPGNGWKIEGFPK